MLETVIGLVILGVVVTGAYIALSVKKAPSVPKTGGQVTGGETTDEETVGKRQGGFAPPSGPAAE